MMQRDPRKQPRPNPSAEAEDGSQKLREIAEEEAKRIEKRGKEGRDGVAALPKSIDGKTASLKDLDAMLRGRRAVPPAKAPPSSDPLAE